MLKKLFLQHYIKRISRYFQANRGARLFTVAGIVLTFLLIGLGVYLFTYRGLQFSQSEEYLAEVAPLFLYQVFILTVGFLILASAIISGLFTFFKRQTTDTWIVTTPAYRILVVVNFIQVVFNASWPFIIIALPMLLAANTIFGFSATGFGLVFVSLALFAVSCAALGVGLVFIAATIAAKLSTRVNRFRMLAGIAAGAVTFFGLLIWRFLTNLDLFELFQVDDLELASATADRIIDRFRYFPSHYPALTLYGAQLNDTVYLTTYFSRSLILFIISIALFTLTQTYFLSLWQLLAEGGFEAREQEEPRRKRALPYRLTKLLINLRSFRSPAQVLFIKELLFNIRTTKNFMWAGFLAILMFIFLGLVPILGNLGSGTDELDRVGLIIIATQFSVISFFVGAFVLRFVFPAFSQEGPAAWILGSAPIDIAEIFLQKIKFYSLINILLVTTAALFFYFNLETMDIEISILEAVAFLGSILILTITVTIIGLGLGVKFVNFQIEDPQLMGTSLPGLALVGLVLFFGLVGGALFYQYLDSGGLSDLIVFNIVLVLSNGLIIRSALKSLERLEYPV